MGNFLSGDEAPLDDVEQVAGADAAPASETTTTAATETTVDETVAAPKKRKRRATPAAPAVVEIDAHAEPVLKEEPSAAEVVPELPTKDSDGALPAAVGSGKPRFNKTYRKRRSAGTTRRNSSA
jgi:hypothetical protein